MTLSVQLTTSIAESRCGNLQVFEYAHDFRSKLLSVWPKEEIQPLRIRDDYSFAPRFKFAVAAPEPTSWKVAFTPTFIKSIAGMDKKLQGRVLGALGELSEHPVSRQGDTIKPLVGDLKGLWRYRIGDYRLIYEPQSTNQIVVLLEFSARGGIYD